jgi:tRNA A-37 threonylcarbamoyl transferase component Bud32
MSWRCDGWTGELAEPYRPADQINLVETVARLTDPAAALKTLHWGRNYLYVSRIDTAAGPLDVVVKQFRNAGLKDRLSRRWRGSKAAKSWRVAEALLAAGLRTPEPVMLIESASAAGPSLYVCRYLDDVLEVRYLLRAANASREKEDFPGVDLRRFLEALGRMARRLHDAGFWHRDFSSGNVLLRTDAAGTPTDLYLVDLNRTRMGKALTTSERLRDLSRMPIFRPEHQDLFLASYWGGKALRKDLYLAYHRAFVWKNETKKKLRGGLKGLRLGPRVAHAHIPAAPADASARDRIVWDHLSDQPHQHAGRFEKMRVRLADAGPHLVEGAVIAAAAPRIWRRYRALVADLHQKPVTWDGVGLCLRPWPENPQAPLDRVAELGVRHLLIRLHPWEESHAAEEELARALHARGCELSFALPQNRDLVKDPGRWRAAVERLAAAFTPYGRAFQIGQAINRSKWGIWTTGEYVPLARAAAEILRRHPGAELIGPAVIDFEHHVTAAVLNRRDLGFRFDAVSSLLYVDRRGAPESEQAGFDTEGKVALLKAIAETARNSTGRCWITEVNWPLWEGPHSPAGRSVSVDEETQADYLVRYYLLTLGTGLVERVFWWQLAARGYGLVDPADPAAPRRRPSYFAFQTLLRELAGARLEAVAASAPARLYLFRRPGGGETAVAWSTSGPATVRLPRPAVSAVGRNGEKLPVPAGAEVPASGSIVYWRLTPG